MTIGIRAAGGWLLGITGDAIERISRTQEFVGNLKNRLYHFYGVIECRHLIDHLVERALGNRPIHTDAPMSVEAVLSRNGTQTILHLINSTGVESKPLLEPVPVGPVTVAMTGPLSPRDHRSATKVRGKWRCRCCSIPTGRPR